ncbi:MAG: hypothetical protein IT172_00290 [Acidobacteria bacterium]|nr:hypothetical protein [Acidobacteriota bacterium]
MRVLPKCICGLIFALICAGAAPFTAFAQRMTPCEQTIARAFGDAGAYFSNPHDGEPIDLTVGFSSLGNADAGDLFAGDNHLYASSTDPEARSAVYIPRGGKLVPVARRDKGDSIYVGRLESGDAYSIVQFSELRQTLFILHAVNVKRRPKGSDGRSKLGEMGTGGGGEWHFRTIDKTRSPESVWHPSFHYHFELYSGLLNSFEAATEPVAFDDLCALLER